MKVDPEIAMKIKNSVRVGYSGYLAAAGEWSIDREYAQPEDD